MLNNLGKRIKTLREEKGLSISQLAKASGVTRSMISQIEKSCAYPSLFTLSKISETLNISLSKLFEESEQETESNLIIRAHNQKQIPLEPGSIMQHILSPGFNHSIEFTIWELLPETEPPKELSVYQHKGEEHFYVLSGEATLFYDGKKYSLHPGDSGCFNPSLPHTYTCVGNQRAQIILAASYVGYTVTSEK